MKRNSKMSCRILILSIVMVLAAGAINAQSGKANFAGKWTLNAEKSTMPQGGGNIQRMGGDFDVTQDAAVLTRSRTGQDGNVRVTKYNLDGKESINTSPRGESKSTVSWSADGKTLTISTVMNFDGNERKMTEVWTLTDPKTLTIVADRPGQNGNVKSTLVYNKK
jgi:Tol biopolymer transport system component